MPEIFGTATFSRAQAGVLIVTLLLAGLAAVLPQQSQAQAPVDSRTPSSRIRDSGDCGLSLAGASSTDPRRLSLSVRCPGANFYKLSEAPDFREAAGSGVSVSLADVDPDGNYADLVVDYPGNVQASAPAAAFSLSAQTKTARVLFVLFDTAQHPAGAPFYATPGWAAKVASAGNYDGRQLANSLRHLLDQTSYGLIDLAADVYPGWVRVDAPDAYRQSNPGQQITRVLAQDIVNKIIANDPGYFQGRQYDFLVGLAPGLVYANFANFYDYYSQTWAESNGIFDGFLLMDLPVDSSSRLAGPIVNEPRTSETTTTLTTLYNVQSVDGVWLASDPNHLGTNYFTGGSVQTPKYVDVIKLGTALPAANTAVLVSYRPDVYRTISDGVRATAPPETLLGDDRWFGGFSHEFIHAAAWLLNPRGANIGDLYQNTWELLKGYELMADGNWNAVEANGMTYAEPGQFSAYTKYRLGIYTPYTLTYGEDYRIRLYRAEEGAGAYSDRIKAVKIPLRPAGDPGFWKMIDYRGTEREYTGDEYLIAEWRSKAATVDGSYNFDRALPGQGLLIYRTVEGDSAAFTGDDTKNIVRLQDATGPQPPFAPPPAWAPPNASAFYQLSLDEQDSVGASPAAFGPASGTYTFVADDDWQRKSTDVTTAAFEVSAASGVRTIYAKFMDMSGTTVAQSSLAIDFGPAATAVPTSTPTSTPTATPSPTATSTPRPTATNTPAPAATATAELHVGDMDGLVGVTDKRWAAKVAIVVHDAAERTVASATVRGQWSTGATVSCKTNSQGTCAVSINNLPLSSSSVTFTVSDVTKASYTYRATANHDPDGDLLADGKSVVVSQ